MKRASHPKAVEFQFKIDQLGFSRQVVEFEQSTRSAQEAADAIGCDLGQIVKSLIFKGKQSNRGILILTSGSNRVDEKKIRASIGEKLGKTDADFVRQITGYSIGGIPPFGHQERLNVFMDADFFEYELIWAAAGTPNAVFPISPDELVSASGGKVISVKVED